MSESIRLLQRSLDNITKAHLIVIHATSSLPGCLNEPFLVKRSKRKDWKEREYHRPKRRK
jgi:hypothetical protein